MNKTAEELTAEDFRRSEARLNAVKKMEPEALGAFDAGYASGPDAARLSTAISLKRIADALEKLNSGDVNAYGIGAEIGRGMGDHFVAVMAQNGR